MTESDPALGSPPPPSPWRTSELNLTRHWSDRLDVQTNEYRIMQNGLRRSRLELRGSRNDLR
eukprot:6384833-Alexandrium_andersonii.AAC.1